LGPRLEATAEPAGLITGGADLQHGQRSTEVDPAPAQPGQLAKAQAGAEQGRQGGPPKQRGPGQQPPGLLRGEGPTLGRTEDLLRVNPALGRGTLWTGLASIAPSSVANWKIRSARDRHWARVAGPTLRSRWACQRRTSAGVILSIGRSANQGRTCSRSRLSALTSEVGLGSSATQVSHHSVAQALNDSRRRWRPRQVPRRISSRFWAARSRASSGVSTVLPPWEPSS